MKSIDFRTNKDQIHPNEGKVTFRGKCPITGVRLYDCEGGNDPRGFLGNHAIGYFVASEYGMIGPDLLVSWTLVMNERENYEKGLALAKTNWKEKK